ncbi:MAG: oligosaccharide flippase family protein [Pseudomonadota bacterium]
MLSPGLRGAAILNAVAVFQIILRLFVFVWLSRLLVPEEFGLAAIAITIVLMAGALNDAGMSSVLVRRSRPARTLTLTVFWTQAGLGIVLAALVAVLAVPLGWAFGRPDVVALILLATPGLVASGISTVPWALLQRDQRFGAIAVSDTVTTALGVAVAGGLATAGAGAYAALSLFVVPMVARALLLLIVSGLRPRFRFSARALRSILPYSLNLLGEQLLGMASQQLDRALIGLRLGAPPLGVYHQAGQIFVIPLQVLAWGTRAALYPGFAQQKDDPARLARSYLRSTGMFVALLFPVYVGIAFVADPMLRLLLGPEASQTWAEVAPVLSILCLGGLALSAGNFNSIVLQSLGLSRYMFTNAALSIVLLAVGLGVGLAWGIKGAAAGVAIATTLSNGALSLRVAQVLDVKGRVLLGTLGGPLTATAAMALVLWGVSPWLPVQPLSGLIAQVALGALAYTAALLVAAPQLCWQMVRAGRPLTDRDQ